MALIVGTPYVNSSGVAVNTFTVPAGVTEQQVLFASALTADAAVITATLSSSRAGATFAILDQRSGTTGRIIVFKGKGLQAGDTVTLTLSVAKQLEISHIYDDYDYNGEFVAATKPSSTTVVTTPSISVTAGESFRLVGLCKTSTATTQTLTVTNPEVVTINSSINQGSTLPGASNYIGQFVAGATGTKTATSTSAIATNTGYIGMFRMTPIVPAHTPPTVRSAGVYTMFENKIGVGVAISNATSIHVEATPVGGGSTVVGSSVTPSAYGWAYATVTGLAAGTKYNIAIKDNFDNSTIETLTASTMTSARKSFKVLSSSCQKGGTSNPTVYPVMTAEGADFFAHQGDIHYLDTDVETTWRGGLDSSLSKSNMRNFLRTTPMTYKYDNHDWGGNASNRTSAVATFGPPAIRELMGDQLTTQGMQATWSNGGVRFIETDQYAYRDEAYPNPLDNFRVGKTMLGLQQRQWLFDTWESSTEPLIIWFCSFPLYGNYVGNGRWGNYRDEAAIIGAWLDARPNVKKKIVCIGGDSHNILADDGTNTMWNLPSLNASPIDRSGDTPPAVSATWNIANHVPANQDLGRYSLLSFNWVGDTVNFKWDGKAEDGSVAATWSKSFSNDISRTGRPKVWNGTAWVDKPAKVWNGTAWVTEIVRGHDGTSFTLSK